MASADLHTVRLAGQCFCYCLQRRAAQCACAVDLTSGLHLRSNKYSLVSLTSATAQAARDLAAVCCTMLLRLQ